jgi:nitroreductase
MLWAAFCALNERRRAIRTFDGSPVADEDVRAILEQALLAPSSGNLQPYEVHWVRDPAERVRVAHACRGQSAATSAGVLLVFSCSVDIARRTAAARLAYVNSCDALDDNSKSYHREQVGRFSRFMRWGTSGIWSPLYAAVCALWPALAVVPIGAAAARHWAARSSIYAAQTVLLAAAARGLDSCPMEGFDGRKVASALALPRGTLIPIVIALGRRSADARVEPRWRRDFSNAVVIH